MSFVQATSPDHPGLTPLESKFAFHIVLKLKFSNLSIQNMEGILNFLKHIIDSAKTSFGRICAEIKPKLSSFLHYMLVPGKTLLKIPPAPHQPVEQSRQNRRNVSLFDIRSFKTTPKGNSYVLSMIDAFTKYIHIVHFGYWVQDDF
ncbi:hypothetical protein TNCV_1082461 [Trichonephila clavipes]|nr:hypothetical protein TNCV_1082461 [Trichonephila clavipes]